MGGEGKEASTGKKPKETGQKRGRPTILFEALPSRMSAWKKVAESGQETMNDIFIFLDEKREIGEDWRKYEPQHYETQCYQL